MRLSIFLAIGLSLLTLSCSRRNANSEQNNDANSLAGRLGQAAHKFSRQADKAAQSMGKDLKKAAHDAHEGWKEEDRKRTAAGK